MAAFDTIDHSILLDRLEKDVGIRETALKWMKFYLSDMTQRAVINGKQLEAVRLNIGVPQGSVLGPVLFLVYILPLHQIMRRHSGVKHHGYADDWQLYINFMMNDKNSYLRALHRLEAWKTLDSGCCTTC